MLVQWLLPGVVLPASGVRPVLPDGLGQGRLSAARPAAAWIPHAASGCCPGWCCQPQGVRAVLPGRPGQGRFGAATLRPGFCTPPTKATRHLALRAVCIRHTRPPKRLQRE